MKKKIVAFLATLTMCFSMVTPAFAASLSSGEQKVLKHFDEVLQYWVEATKDSKGHEFNEEHRKQYFTEAENALLALDLTDAACDEFYAVVDEVNQVFKDAGCKTREELWACYPKIIDKINSVGKKYYNLHVTVEDKYEGEVNGHWAKVTYEVPSNNGSGTKKSTAASTSGVVKQTGFGLGQTAVVAVAAATMLVGAYVVARKKNLFDD